VYSLGVGIEDFIEKDKYQIAIADNYLAVRRVTSKSKSIYVRKFDLNEVGHD
jgi:hypothetical protein